MATWRVGKTMLGFGKPAVDMPAQTERQAKYKLGQVMRQTAANYRLVMSKDDPHGWRGMILRLEEMADDLESGYDWPAMDHGMNWVWSLPWGSHTAADRDLWVFWARAEAAGGGAGDAGAVVEIGPRGGAARELVGAAEAA